MILEVIARWRLRANAGPGLLAAMLKEAEQADARADLDAAVAAKQAEADRRAQRATEAEKQARAKAATDAEMLRAIEQSRADAARVAALPPDELAAHVAAILAGPFDSAFIRQRMERTHKDARTNRMWITSIIERLDRNNGATHAQA